MLTHTAQTICGLSVVPGDWDALKRYNLTELYKLATSGDQDADGDADKVNIKKGEADNGGAEEDNKHKATTESAQ